MEQDDTQALNKKLAEWAGWHDFNQARCGYPPNDISKQPRLYPIFTTSLDACFKWLVPKLLDREGYHFELRSPYKRMDYCFVIGKHNEYESWTLYSGEAETPALALCLAIEKLIKED